jgi:hypothetical protein
MESATAKFKTMIDAEKRVIRRASMKVGRVTQDVARLLRIIVFLHSAKDFPSRARRDFDTVTAQGFSLN